MPVIIAHGQPKSGSTFLFQTVLEIIGLVEQENFYSIFSRLMGEGVSVFFAKIDLDAVQHVASRAGKHTLVMKTHGALPDDVRKLIERGDVRAFTSFRDPRDACRSMLDAGASDRAKGSNRWFATKTKAEELIRPIAGHMRDLQSWMACPQVLSMPYYIISNDQDYAVRTLCEHLGFGAIGRVMAGIMQEKKTAVPEFHKGVSDRFLTDFGAQDVEMLNGALAKEIARYDSMLVQKMRELNHHILCEHLVHMRNEMLSQMKV